MRAFDSITSMSYFFGLGNPGQASPEHVPVLGPNDSDRSSLRWIGRGLLISAVTIGLYFTQLTITRTAVFMVLWPRTSPVQKLTARRISMRLDSQRCHFETTLAIPL